MKHIIALLSLLGLVTFVLEADAYQINVSKTGKKIHWADSKLPVAWYLNMNGYTAVSEANSLKSFKDAMQQWSGQACTKFRDSYKGKTTKVKDSRDRVNVLMFGSLGATSSTTTAKTYYSFLTSGELLDADIVFRTTKPWSVTPTSKQNDLRGTAAHEIGHFIGLGHSTVLSATMYKSAPPGPSNRRFIDADDIKGLCANYPKGGQTTTAKRGEICGNGNPCSSGLLCVGVTGQPAYCFESCSNGACSNGGKCLKTTSGNSFCACDKVSDCQNGQTCNNRNCMGSPKPECTKDGDCQSGFECKQNKCVKKVVKPECTKDDDCQSGFECKETKCVKKAPAGCAQDSDCTNGLICQSGQCVRPPPKGFGEPCQQKLECTSQFCEGVGPNGTLFCSVRCQAGSSSCPAGYDCRESGSQWSCQIKKTSGGELAQEKGDDSEGKNEDASSPGDSASGSEQGTTVEDVEKGGCQCSEGSLSDLSFVFLSLFLLLFVRRSSLTQKVS